MDFSRKLRLRTSALQQDVTARFFPRSDNDLQPTPIKLIRIRKCNDETCTKWRKRTRVARGDFCASDL